MGARQHLALLDKEGLVTTIAGEPGSRGRPVNRWKLTAEGHSRFPDAHAQVTADMVISIKDVLGDDALNKVIANRTKGMLADYHAVTKSAENLEEALRLLCELRTSEGYMAEYQPLGDGSFALIEHHCPICIAAKSCQGFCDSELEVFQATLKRWAKVSRDEHLIAGARRCSYLIEARKNY